MWPLVSLPYIQTVIPYRLLCMSIPPIPFIPFIPSPSTTSKNFGTWNGTRREKLHTAQDNQKIVDRYVRHNKVTPIKYTNLDEKILPRRIHNKKPF